MATKLSKYNYLTGITTEKIAEIGSREYYQLLREGFNHKVEIKPLKYLDSHTHVEKIKQLSWYDASHKPTTALSASLASVKPLKHVDSHTAASNIINAKLSDIKY